MITLEVSNVIQCRLVYNLVNPSKKAMYQWVSRLIKLFILLDLITLPGTYPKQIIRSRNIDLNTMNS